MSPALLRIYYAATFVFVILDYALGINVRLAFLEAMPSARAAWYVVCFACLLTVAYGFVPRILETFRAAHPNVKVRLLDETGLRVADRVRAGEAEFGIDMRLRDDPEIDFEPLAEEPYVMACSADHPLAGRGPLRWSALNDGDYVAFGLDSGIGRQLATPQSALTWAR